MEAIKCPNCGSERVEEISEEKYQCLSCDNTFLIHNLSKEFKMTDKHIEDVHNDLKEIISNIVVNGGTEIQADFENGFNLIKIKKYDAALELFNKLCESRSYTYKAWFGKYMALTKDFTVEDEDAVCSEEYIECIDNMRKCKDFPQDIDNKIIQYLECIFTENKNTKMNIREQLNASIKGIENRKEEEIKSNSDTESSFESETKLKEIINCITVIQWIVTIVSGLIAEGLVIKKLFFGWLMASITAINAPMPAATDSGAGTALKNGFLNLIAIPLKFIILVAVIAVVAFAIYKLLDMVFDELRLGYESKLDKQNSERENHNNKINNLNSQSEDLKRQLSKLNGQIALYGMINFKDLSTLRAYKKEFIADPKKNNLKIPDKVKVELTEAGQDSAKVIKSVHEVTGLGFLEAKELVDNAPKVIKEDASKEEAEKIKTKLEAEGAKVTIKFK